jgi:hypothetical protein
LSQETNYSGAGGGKARLMAAPTGWDTDELLGKRQVETEMNAGEQSLRWLVHKWFGHTSANAWRLTRPRQAHSSANRCVCLEISSEAGDALKIFFFRHDDGTWRVFPPAPKKPAFSLD